MAEAGQYAFKLEMEVPLEVEYEAEQLEKRKEDGTAYDPVQWVEKFVCDRKGFGSFSSAVATIFSIAAALTANAMESAFSDSEDYENLVKGIRELEDAFRDIGSFPGWLAYAGYLMI